jgi:hypothetical protein
MLRWVISVGALVGALVAPSGAHAPTVSLHFRVLAETGIRLTDIAWTGDRFLYVENTTNTVWSAPPSGSPLAAFATMPQKVEETRCRVSPGTHGWEQGLVFCHSPDNVIYRITADGRGVTVFARLPETAISDGALAFDTGGAFGFGMVAVTGRSGSTKAAGGNVYAVDNSGSVRRVAHYAGPGGADEVEIAPSGFGRAARAALLTVDATSKGKLLAVRADGSSTVVARFADGPNPIAAVVPSPIRGGAHAGLYVTDTLSKTAFVAPASDLRRYQGRVIVGSELKGLFWVVRPRPGGFETRRLTTTLHAKHYNLEGMAYVSR